MELQISGAVDDVSEIAVYLLFNLIFR